MLQCCYRLALTKIHETHQWSKTQREHKAYYNNYHSLVKNHHRGVLSFGATPTSNQSITASNYSTENSAGWPA